MPSSEYLDLVATVTRLAPGTTVGVPYPCRTPRRNVAATIRRLGPGLEVVEAESADDPAIACCDVVVTWNEQGAHGLDAAPGRVLSWRYGIDPAGVVHLRRQLGI